MTLSSIKGRKSCPRRKKKSKLSSKAKAKFKEDNKYYYQYEDDSDDEAKTEEQPPQPNREPIMCTFCKCVHSPVGPCNGQSCESCYSKDHIYVRCPYMRDLPRGVNFNSEYFEIHCHCGCPFFDKDTWKCLSKRCGLHRPKLETIYCRVCLSDEVHNTYNCPNDKEKSALLKATIERAYLRQP